MWLHFISLQIFKQEGGLFIFENSIAILRGNCIVGVYDDKIDNTDRPVAVDTFDDIPDYTLFEVSSDKIKDMLEDRGLLGKLAKRRKELFVSLEEFEPEPEISSD